MRSNVFPEAGAKIEERLATARTRVVEKHEMCRPKGTGKQRGRKDVQDSAKRVIESREQRPQDMALAAAEVLDDFANKGGTGGMADQNRDRMLKSQQAAAKAAVTPRKRKADSAPSTPTSSEKKPSYMKSTAGSRSARSIQKTLSSLPENTACDEKGHY